MYIIEFISSNSDFGETEIETQERDFDCWKTRVKELVKEGSKSIEVYQKIKVDFDIEIK